MYNNIVANEEFKFNFRKKHHSQSKVESIINLTEQRATPDNNNSKPTCQPAFNLFSFSESDIMVNTNNNNDNRLLLSVSVAFD